MPLSNKIQLNIIGVFLLILLGLSAWSITQQFTWLSVLPLLFIGYAAFRVVFELTYNRANVPTMATTYMGRKKIAAYLKREVLSCGKDNYTILDLGSGRGELSRRIAKTISAAQVIGIEQAKIPYMQATFVQRWFGPKNLSYQCRDFWPFDCTWINAIVLYLNPSFAARVGEKLQREMKSGGIVISYTFPLLGAWTPVEVLNFRSPFKETIYIYRKK